MRALLGLWVRVVWHPRVEGLGHVPTAGPVLIASNHVSFFDSVVLPLVVPRRVVFLAKAEYFEGRGVRGTLVRAWFEAIGAVPVKRGTHGEAMASLELALGVLRRGDVHVRERRHPRGPEAFAVMAGSVIVRCADEHGPLELAMSDQSYTGFASWLESAPPGQNVSVA